MKKTLTVNLGGTVYHMDEDAYQLLEAYLTGLHDCFRHEQGADEIVKDFEIRMAELFGVERQGDSQPITAEEVEKVIGRMGRPEDFVDDSCQESAGKEASGNRKEKSSKKLFRDPDDRMLGGVASGIAAYGGFDTTLVRIVCLLLLFIPGLGMTTVLAYMALWLVVPMARTAADKLSMRGEKVTVEGIGRTVTGGFERAVDAGRECFQSEQKRSSWKRVGDVAVTVAGAVLKVALILMALLFCPIIVFCLIVAVMALIGMAFGGGVWLYSFLPDALPTFSFAPSVILFLTVMLILLAGIPLVGLIHVVLTRLFHTWGPMSTMVKRVLWVLWLGALVSLIVWLMCHPELFTDFSWFLETLNG